MPQSLFVDPIQILKGPNQPIVQDAVLIQNRKIQAFGDEARKQALKLTISAKAAPHQLLAPCLVDPHSILEEPLNGRSENLQSLRAKLVQAGYGQIALLPRSPTWRDDIESLQGFNNSTCDVKVHLWGGFSKKGKGKELAPHSELLANGVIGLAEDDRTPPIGLLYRGLSLREMGDSPLLLAARDIDIQGNGVIREGVDSLRAGWIPDPIASETVPLAQLLELHKCHPKTLLRLMNISTSEACTTLSRKKTKIMASVCWWHLINDTESLDPNKIGWKVIPSLGTPKDRKALIKALKDGVLSAIAAHAVPLDQEEVRLPPQTRSAGVSGYSLILPLLWQELVIKNDWQAEELWEALSFGPSRMLKVKEECLELGSNRWVIFDPNEKWLQVQNNKRLPYCANQPLQQETITGKVQACGLIS